MKVFDFEDVQLLPKRCITNSRSECDPSVSFANYRFKLPIVPANMKSIISEDLALQMAERGYFYVMHRFNVDTVKFVKKAHQKKLIASISIGVKPEWFEVIDQLAEQKLIPEFITIDIAHGHANSMKKMIKHIRAKMGKQPFIIAGNIATPEAVVDLERWGADATKVGVGPGRVCITRLKTGFGTAGWQLSAIKWLSKSATKPMIADGGVRHPGDIAKAIRFGATFVMAGSILAGHKESPTPIIKNEGQSYKEYYGSASEYNKGERRHVEGKKELVPLRGSIWDTFKEIEQDLQSAISYAGGLKLNALKKVSYILLKNNEGY
ncbi:GMP reductase [Mycoplasma sp. ATU-Cv-703]|uniref:GMP reductase n=1 Tax=Mycoplasma sp. ATU-Cv-703 TaxID=2498595 RepID=UPI000FDF41D4